MRKLLKMAIIIFILLIFAFSNNSRISTIRNHVIILSKDIYGFVINELKAIDNENVTKVVEIID